MKFKVGSKVKYIGTDVAPLKDMIGIIDDGYFDHSSQRYIYNVYFQSSSSCGCWESELEFVDHIMKCKYCKSYDVLMQSCDNDHIREYIGEDDIDSDCLTYSYAESGMFQVGDNFGCVHFERRS